IPAVRHQRRLDDAAVDLHPLEEPLDQSVARGSGLDDPDDASLTKMLEEPADARDNLAGAIARGARAPAGRAVPRERRDGRLVDPRQPATPERDPNAEVRDGVEMESGNLGVEPVP